MPAKRLKIYVLIIYSENIKVALTRVYTGSADASWHFMAPIISELQFSIWNIFASYAPHLELNLLQILFS